MESGPYNCNICKHRNGCESRAFCKKKIEESKASDELERRANGCSSCEYKPRNRAELRKFRQIFGRG